MSRTILLEGAQWRVWMDDVQPRGESGGPPPRRLRFARVAGLDDPHHDRDFADPEHHDAQVNPHDFSEEFLQSRLRELMRG